MIEHILNGLAHILISIDDVSLSLAFWLFLAVTVNVYDTWRLHWTGCGSRWQLNRKWCVTSVLWGAAFILIAEVQLREVGTLILIPLPNVIFDIHEQLRDMVILNPNSAAFCPICTQRIYKCPTYHSQLTRSHMELWCFLSCSLQCIEQSPTVN